MGIELNYDIDTTYGNTQNLYVNIETVCYNLDKGTMNVAVSYWYSEETYRDFSQREDRVPEGLVRNRFIYYRNEEDTGTEIELPVIYSFNISNIKDVHNCIKYIQKEIDRILKEI